MAALVVAVLVGGCTGGDDTVSPSPTAPPALVTPPGPITISDGPLVLDSLDLPGLIFRQQTQASGSRYIYRQWPVIPGATALNAQVSEWANEELAEFRESTTPSKASPPEFNLDAEVVFDNDAIYGVRVHQFEFLGASAADTSRTAYGSADGAIVVDGVGLFTASGARAAVTEIEAAIVDGGYGVASEDVRPSAAEVLADVTFTRAGDARVAIGSGAVAPNSAGELVATIPKARVTPWLSVPGSTVATAATTVPQGQPTVTPTPLQPSATSATAATPPASPTTNRPSPTTSTARPTTPATASPTPRPTAKPTPSPTPSPTPKPPGSGKVDCRKVRCVALTFDDGPGSLTPTLLTSLKSARVPATFFVLGQNAQVHPETIRKMAADGHQIGNHTWDHRDLKRLSLAEQRSQIDRTAKAITAIVGVTPTTLRPPYGSYSADTKKLGLPVVLWNIGTEDWKNRNVEQTTKRALQARAGSIVLMHDIHSSTIKAVPGIIKGLRAKGFTLVTLDTLVGPMTPGKVYSAGRAP